MRRRNRKQQIAISEGELVAMTHDLEDAHHETLPSMHDSLTAWSESDDDIRSLQDEFPLLYLDSHALRQSEMAVSDGLFLSLDLSGPSVTVSLLAQF